MDVCYKVLYLDESETKLTQDAIREKLHRMDVEHTQGKPKVSQLVFSNQHMRPILIYPKFQYNHTVVLVHINVFHCPVKHIHVHLDWSKIVCDNLTWY